MPLKYIKAFGDWAPSYTEYIRRTLHPVIWKTCGYLVLGLIPQSILLFLMSLYPIEPNKPSYILATAALIRALLNGWLFFSVFHKPKPIDMVPGNDGQPNSKESQMKWGELWFISLSSLVVMQTGLRFGTDVGGGGLPTSLYILFCIIVAIWSIFRLKKWLQNKQLENHKLEVLPTPAILKLQERAIKKINKRLSQDEVKELNRLVYEIDVAHRFTVQTIIWIVIRVAFVMLAIEVIKGLVKRF